MPVADPDSRRRATVIFKLAVKASTAGVHRTLNRAPKGKGWVQCASSPAGIMCRPEKARESIALFSKAYQTYPDIAALNSAGIALAKMLDELEAARQHFTRMREQLAKCLLHYVQAARTWSLIVCSSA